MGRFLAVLCLLVSVSAFARDVSIIKKKDCFDPPFDYHSWIAKLEAMNAGSPLSMKNPNLIREKFPEAVYNQRKAELNCHHIAYTVDGIGVQGFIVVPKDAKTKLPVVIYNRGGNMGFSAIIFGGALWQNIFPIAESGFIVMASQYRGLPFTDQTPTEREQFGGSDLEDVLAMIDLAAALPEADMTRIATVGWSRGAIMSYLAAAKDPRIKAVVAGAGPADLLDELTFRPEMEKVYQDLIPNYMMTKESALAARSPALIVPSIQKDTPFLLLHGEKDDRVPVASARKMEAVLRELGRTVELRLYPDGGHLLTATEPDVTSYTNVWLKNVLR